MNLNLCNCERIGKIYSVHMKTDFPPNELKPLFAIFSMYERGEYDFFSLDDGGDCRSYAGICRSKNAALPLLDYFAVVKQHRGKGLGHAMLSALSQHYTFLPGVLIESEDPDCACGEADFFVRQRRVRFYYSCGCLDTGIRSNVYGADYSLLYLPFTNPTLPSRAFVEKAYRDLYHVMIPDGKIYKKFIHIK